MPHPECGEHPHRVVLHPERRPRNGLLELPILAFPVCAPAARDEPDRIRAHFRSISGNLAHDLRSAVPESDEIQLICAFSSG
jgi:hypothetical protein